MKKTITEKIALLTLAIVSVVAWGSAIDAAADTYRFINKNGTFACFIDDSNILQCSFDASDMTTGTLPDARLSTNVTTEGNTFNGANQLVKLDGSGDLPVLDGSALTGIVASSIADDIVTTAKINDDAVTSEKILNNSVNSDDLRTDSVGSDEIQTDAVGSDEIAANAVDTSEINTGAVTTPKLAADAVTNPKIITDAIDARTIATDAVGSDEIAANAVDTSEINDSAVTTSKLATDSVSNAKLLNFSVTTEKLASGAVSTSKLLDGSVSEAKLNFNPATQPELNAHSGTSDAHHAQTTALAASAITAGTFPTGTWSFGVGTTMTIGSYTFKPLATDATICSQTCAGHATARCFVGSSDTDDTYISVGTSAGEMIGLISGLGPCD